MSKKVRKVQITPLAGFKGTVHQMTYGHAIKIGIPSSDRYAPNHAMDCHLSMTLTLSDEDDWEKTENELIDHVHSKLEEVSDQQKQWWMKELGIE
jgi:hypothetical protein